MDVAGQSIDQQKVKDAVTSYRKMQWAFKEAEKAETRNARHVAYLNENEMTEYVRITVDIDRRAEQRSNATI